LAAIGRDGLEEASELEGTAVERRGAGESRIVEWPERLAPSACARHYSIANLGCAPRESRDNGLQNRSTLAARPPLEEAATDERYARDPRPAPLKPCAPPLGARPPLQDRRDCVNLDSSGLDATDNFLEILIT
jgi:hypothetical protein